MSVEKNENLIVTRQWKTIVNITGYISYKFGLEIGQVDVTQAMQGQVDLLCLMSITTSTS